MPFMGMLVFLVLFCGALMYGMYRVLGKQATQAADRFSTMSEDFEKKKADLKKLTQETERKAEQLISAAQKECDQLRSKAAEEVQATRMKTIQETRHEAERIVSDAMKARDAMKLELVEEMHVKTIEAACQLVLTIFPVQLRQDVHDYWLNELLEQGLQALDRFESREEIKAVEVVSAFPLDDAHREKILKSIQKKINTEIKLVESVNPDLVAGLRMTLGHLVLEGSLAEKLKEAALHAKNNRS